MSLVIKFYFTSSMLNMFRTFIHPSSGACDLSIVSPHWSCVLVSVCVGVSVWLGWGGIHIAGFSLLTDREPATFLLYHHIGCVFLFQSVLEFRCGWVGVVST